MAAPAATTATPPFASRQRGGEGLFALKSLASARPARPRQQRSLREPKPVLSAGKSKILAVGVPARPVVRRRERAAVSGLARRACERSRYRDQREDRAYAEVLPDGRVQAERGGTPWPAPGSQRRTQDGLESDMQRESAAVERRERVQRVQGAGNRAVILLSVVQGCLVDAGSDTAQDANAKLGLTPKSHSAAARTSLTGSQHPDPSARGLLVHRPLSHCA